MSKFVYTGQENLEAMQEAKNYNRFLTALISEEAKKTSKDKRLIKILDFGAGIGTYADMLRDLGYRVDCLELDEEQIIILKEKKYKVYKTINEINSQYDIIYALNVFEHIEDDIKVFEDLSDKLKPGGVGIIYVPAMQIAYSAMDKLVGHYRRYDLKRLKLMATSSQLQIVKLGYLEPIGLLASLAYKYIGNKQGSISSSSVKLYDRLAFPISKFISPLFTRIGGKNALLVARRSRHE